MSTNNSKAPVSPLLRGDSWLIALTAAGSVALMVMGILRMV